MKKYSVSATVSIEVEFVLEANSNEEAYEIADNGHYSIQQWNEEISEFHSHGFYLRNINTQELTTEEV